MGLYVRTDVKGQESWRYDFIVNGVRHSATLGPMSKTRAKELYEKAKVAARAGEYETEKTEDPLFNAIAEEYLDYYKVRHRTTSYDRHRYAFAATKKAFGTKRLSKITPHTLSQYITKRKEDGRSEVTINRELAFLKNLFNTAIEWGKAKDNPVNKIKLFREDNGRTRYLTKDEEDRLLAECKLKRTPSSRQK